MEALAAAGTCLELLGVSLKILDRAKAALDRTKNGTAYLSSVATDVRAIFNVIDLIKIEPEFQTDHMLSAVTQVQARAILFTRALEALDKESETENGLKIFMKYFIEGSREQKKMNKMRNDINDSKLTLILALVTAQVGLMRVTEKNEAVINIVAVRRVNDQLKKSPDVKQGLRIAELLKARGRKEEDGYYLLEEELDELDKEPPYVRPGDTTITTMNNLAEDAGLVVGGPVGKDGGDDNSLFIPTHQITNKNTARRGGTVIGGGIQPRLAKEFRQMDYGYLGSTPAAQPPTDFQHSTPLEDERED